MNTPQRFRILLADDHRLMAEGLRSLLSSEFEVVGVVENGRDLIEMTQRVCPDVIVTDISMPQLNGIDALIQLKKINPQVRVVFLTMHPEAAYARRALDAGAVGYVLKHSAPAELIKAVHAALNGKIFVSPPVAAKIMQSTANHTPAPTSDMADALTPRQREILQLLAEGRSAKEIGSALDVSARTVEFHKYQIMQRLNVRTNAELVHFAIKHGIVDL